ncbi:RNA 2',3'-cyclic phosphodiesterase [bacterium]|nr:RNA 2',3'-cyclic phosphodiesterase [bacterium]
MMRAFIALELPDSVKSKMTEMIAELDAADAKVKWVSDAQMHLTMKFLGELSQEQLKSIKREMLESCNALSSFSLTIGNIGAFPNKRNPRVIWIGVEKNDKLVEVFNQIEKIAVDNDVEPEKRAFSPHLTLGRVKFVDKYSEFLTLINKVSCPPETVEITKLSLIESKLTPSGAIYSPLLELMLD